MITGGWKIGEEGKTTGWCSQKDKLWVYGICGLMFTALWGRHMPDTDDSGLIPEASDKSTVMDISNINLVL